MPVNKDFEVLKSEIIGMVAAKYNIQLGINDPIFTAVAINDAILGIYQETFQKIALDSLDKIRIRIEEIAGNYESDCETIGHNLVVQVKDAIKESFAAAARKAQDDFITNISVAGEKLTSKLSDLQRSSSNSARTAKSAMFLSLAFGVMSLISLGFILTM